MAMVTEYNVLLYGTRDGYGNVRAEIQLFEGADVLGYVRFHDPDMPFQNDSDSGGTIVMHLPSAMLGNVIDVLRYEEPINFYFAHDHAFLGTSDEPVGEAE